MRTVTHVVLIALIAGFLGGFGLWYLSGGKANFDDYRIVIFASCMIWIPISILYRSTETAWVLAAYFGFLSPFIGCLFTIPPWSFVIVFSKPMFSVILGILASALVCAVSRFFEYEFE